LGHFWPSSLPRASPLPLAHAVQLPPAHRAAPPLTGRPHPSARTPLALSRSLSGERAPPVSAFIASVTGASDAIAAGHCPPRCLAIIAFTSSVWRLASARAIPSPHLPEPSCRPGLGHLFPLPPSSIEPAPPPSPSPVSFPFPSTLGSS
jgi:hypothetical protein